MAIVASSQALSAFAARGGIGQDDRFPDPFCDMASLSMPETIQDALRWSEYIIQNNGPYREAISRVVSYFITDVVIDDQSDKRVGKEEREKFGDFLEDTLGIKSVLRSVALDFMTYGNSFTSLLMPFRRYLSCKRCGLELPLKKIYNTPQFKFAWNNFEFTATCPHCKYQGAWRHIDRRSGEQGQIKVKRWSPHEIDLLWDPYTDDVSYIWKIPEDYRNMIRQGHLHHLERASWEIIQAVKHNQNLMFDKDIVYHMKEPALAGLRNRGWGISRVLTNFRQAWYVQVVHRYNEAIALDYIVPFRVITPLTRPGAGPDSSDPVHSINLGAFTARVRSMLAARKRDPARWNVLPFSVEYKALGGDATTLAPRELLDQGLDTLLSSIGVPVEFYKGSLSVQAAPAALRLFEANWSHLVHGLNTFLGKLVLQVAQMLSWEPVAARLARVTHADDLNRQMAKLQLMMGQQISKTTGLASIGLDNSAETRQKLEEQREEAEETQKMQEEMQQSAIMDEMAAPAGPPPGAAAQTAGAPPGGAPPAGAPPGAAGPAPMSALDQFIMQKQNQPNVPVTPDDLQTQAQLIAQELMSQPDTQAKSNLVKLKKVDPTMHALVTSLRDDMKQQAQTVGGAQVMAQQYGKAARWLDL